MIALTLNGSFLDVASSLRIPMEEAFAFDEFLTIPGEHSWKFSLPKTPANRRAFGFADVPEIVWDPATSYQCALYIDGRVFKSGKLFVEKESAEDFQVYFVGTVGILQELFKEKQINELVWPEVTGIIDMFDYAEAAANLPGVSVNPAESAYPVAFFPVVAPALASDGLTGEFFNRMDIQVNVGATDNYLGFDEAIVNALVPFVYLKDFWALLQSEYNLTILGEIFEMADIKRLVFFNTKPLNKQDSVTNEYENDFEDTIKLIEHVPEMQIGTFITEFAKIFNQLVLFDAHTNVITFLPRKNVFDRERVMYSNEQVVDYEILFEKQKTLSLRYDHNEDERIAARAWQGTALGWRGTLSGVDGPEGSTVVESQISTLPMAAHLASGYYYTPFTSESLNSKVGVKLLIFHGKVQPYDPANTPEIDQRPFASCNGSWVTGATQSLVWQGAPLTLTGNWWDEYTSRLYPARTISLRMHLTRNQLLEFVPDKVFVLGHWRCLVKKLKYELGEEDALVEIEVLKF